MQITNSLLLDKIKEAEEKACNIKKYLAENEPFFMAEIYKERNTLEYISEYNLLELRLNLLSARARLESCRAKIRVYRSLLGEDQDASTLPSENNLEIKSLEDLSKAMEARLWL